MMDLKSVLDEVGSWPVEDRLRLIEGIWDGISTTPEAVIFSESQRYDLQSRLNAYRDNPKAGSPWKDVEARLRDNAL